MCLFWPIKGVILSTRHSSLRRPPMGFSKSIPIFEYMYKVKGWDLHGFLLYLAKNRVHLTLGQSSDFLPFKGCWLNCGDLFLSKQGWEAWQPQNIVGCNPQVSFFICSKAGCTKISVRTQDLRIIGSDEIMVAYFCPDIVENHESTHFRLPTLSTQVQGVAKKRGGLRALINRVDPLLFW